MSDNIQYKDSLITINSNKLILHHYYFPTGTSKRIAFSKIDHIESVQPTLLSGKWRFWGTGDFRTWFPADFSRNKKDTIFIIHQKNKRMFIGFTVNNSEEVKKILKEKNMLK
jgi:hypothetical protein